jgi:hypothetical protein
MTETTPAKIRVTVEDLATGEKESLEIMDDYILICAGSCYQDGVQMYANGTHMITVKGRKP